MARKRRCAQALTYNDDVSERVWIADGGAVPPVVSELIPALGGRKTDAVTYGDHRVRR